MYFWDPPKIPTSIQIRNWILHCFGTSHFRSINFGLFTFLKTESITLEWKILCDDWTIFLITIISSSTLFSVKRNSNLMSAYMFSTLVPYLSSCVFGSSSNKGRFRCKGSERRPKNGHPSFSGRQYKYLNSRINT